ncbi:molybdenum cofactor biosynthesis protein A [Rubripirellula tenax]|uniref:Molybdenum cofactor biosynthesis protein A n=1 Tax=Rubripirellula tenax TaxID=2528015 RepID=A0A5C6FEE4_9BACT|nr:arsenosugar biosynthesis radical SAM (seleno)protein ArsS [Rubripirellula tenax]TWU59851.1 molybdenum cofactor biosynthesis protein A [Rubripirellula tenax]
MSSLLPIIDAGLPTGLVEPFGQRMDRNDRPLSRHSIIELQINLGKLCNQTCTHCHVEAGPTKKRENMDSRTATRIIELAQLCESIRTVDLTGGAPEMNANFQEMVSEFRSRGLRVIDRCNLTILSEPGYEWVAGFLADNGVDVVASLPCYLEDNVDGQRGNGVFTRSIDGLQKLNRLGYGSGDPQRKLDLVFNPTGPSLPPDQSTLEVDYKRELKSRYAIEFDHLLCITNIPIKRYATYLNRRGKLDDYMRLLADNFNPVAAGNVMCRSLVSIGWDGAIFDCDFNQMLNMPIGGKTPTTVWDIDTLDTFKRQTISVADHCYGCTAGAGSSCSGAVTK